MQTKDSIFDSRKSLKRTNNLTDYDKHNLGKMCREYLALHTDIFSKERVKMSKALRNQMGNGN